MEEFGVDTSLVQWMTTGYLLVLSVMIPLSPFLKNGFPAGLCLYWRCSCLWRGL